MDDSPDRATAVPPPPGQRPHLDDVDPSVAPSAAVVCHETPALAFGLRVAFEEAGFTVQTSSSLPRAGDVAASAVAVIGVGGRDVSELGQVPTPQTPCLGLAPTVTGGQARHMLSLGWAGLVREDAPPRAVVHAARVAMAGLFVVPSDVVVELLAPADKDRIAIEIDDAERGWLGWLAQGRTVVELARHAGFSERSMHRRLRCLYERLGASSRIEAVAVAARLGSVDHLPMGVT